LAVKEPIIEKTVNYSVYNYKKKEYKTPYGFLNSRYDIPIRKTRKDIAPMLMIRLNVESHLGEASFSPNDRIAVERVLYTLIVKINSTIEPINIVVNKIFVSFPIIFLPSLIIFYTLHISYQKSSILYVE
jgi:hypothetical protein